MIALIKQVFAPSLVGAPKIAHDLAIYVQAERLRTFEQFHAYFLRHLVPLLIVAAFTTGNQIVPVRTPTPRPWHNVIKRKFGRIENLTAVLAGVMIAQQDIFARQAFSLEWNVLVFHQPYD